MTHHNLIRQVMATKTRRLMQITLLTKQIRTLRMMAQQKIQLMRQLQLEIKTQMKLERMIRHQSLILTLRLRLIQTP